MSEQIARIFCGKKAHIRSLNGKVTVVCRSCNRKTEGQTYQKMFDKWLDDIRIDPDGGT